MNGPARRPGLRRPAAALTAAVLCLLAAAATRAAAADGTTTRLRLSSGYDTSVHTYHLATDDTTETIGEVNLGLGLEIRSALAARHRWHLRADASVGNQLLREMLDLGYRWRPAGSGPRLRADVSWTGRQYRPGSDYSLSSDLHEGRGELRAYPWRGRRAVLDLRLSARSLVHRRPSVLEQDQRETGLAAYLASVDDLDGSWRLGIRHAGRAYPDSAAIDRRTTGVEAELQRSGPRGEAWLFHRSEHRRIADPQVRPSAWLHWSEVRLALPAGAGRIVANLDSEVWRYERQTAAWFDAWRADLELGYRWGDLLGVQRQLLLTGQNLAAGDSPEAHTQIGLRGSIEGQGRALGGILSLELGQRWYRDQPASPAADGGDDPLDADLFELAYSDFSYLELWIMATWDISGRFGVELVASYQPERHTEQDDDTSLGYGSLRLVWRP